MQNATTQHMTGAGGEAVTISGPPHDLSMYVGCGNCKVTCFKTGALTGDLLPPELHGGVRRA